MKYLFTYSLLFLLPALSFGQWNQMGNAINGKDDNDRIGATHAVDIDSAGTTIAVGSAINSQFGSFTGFAEVYDWDGTNWNLRGDTFWGDPTRQGTGAAVALSADGLTLALGLSHAQNLSGDNSGMVEVFDWNGTSWTLRGASILGESGGDVFGTALELSADGNHLIVGGRANSPQPFLPVGHVRIFDWNGSSWNQVGQDIDGDTIGGGTQEFGYSVSISDAGDRAIVGARSYNGNAQSSGAVFTFEYNGTEWQQLGSSLIGNDLGEYLGSAVHMTGDGNTISVGAPATSTTGQVVVFDWNGSDWFVRGSVISGTGSSSNTGQSIDMSDDGNIIAVGQPGANSYNGRVRLFEWTGSAWQQLGTEISTTGSTSSIIAFGSAVRINANGSRVAVGAPSVNAGGFNLGEVTVYTDQSDASINEFNQFNIQVFPNPSADVLQISSDVRIERIELLDVFGRLVMEIEVNAETTELMISDLSNGKYLAKIQTVQGVRYSSVVKAN